MAENRFYQNYLEVQGVSDAMTAPATLSQNYLEVLTDYT